MKMTKEELLHPSRCLSTSNDIPAYAIPSLAFMTRELVEISDESGILTHLGHNAERISLLNAYFMLIIDVKVLICIKEGKRPRQGHYEAKMRKKAKKVEGKQSWHSPKSLDESPSGPLARPKLQKTSPLKIPIWRPREWFGGAPNRSPRAYPMNANACNANAAPPVLDHEPVPVPTNGNGGLAAARVHDFVRMNPTVILGLHFSEDPQNFIDEWKDNRGENAALVTWECFIEAFQDRFFPRELRESKAQEFMNVRQGSISVQEYGLQFTQLSRDLEFQIDNWVFLKVSPTKGVMRFGKKGKLSTRYVGPYKILKRVGKVVYELELPAELAAVHLVFLVPLLKNCVGDPESIVPLESVVVNNTLTYEDVLFEILDHQI
ncbi:hypothetical protein MTR67_026703 [Solanum verrucosum]|uniref:Retrotransposon gag domain-containing protein n=1 Tax=Solanum verrucosum TaxID=315347 RepID=A0AAF0R3E3_SOLVR|nr:hypothetical protein MTR67_026703 [Solanum verrucosum]